MNLECQKKVLELSNYYENNFYQIRVTKLEFNPAKTVIQADYGSTEITLLQLFLYLTFCPVLQHEKERKIKVSSTKIGST